MLQATTSEQVKHIATLLEQDFETWSVGAYPIYTLTTDKPISFDQMAAIVDYLRTSDKKDELFEECWKAYRRKGSKKKSLEYWTKLKDKEKSSVLSHIKAYVASREVQYQKDFERYLRDKIFTTVVYQGSKMVYDPTEGNHEDVHVVAQADDVDLVINGQIYR